MHSHSLCVLLSRAWYAIFPYRLLAVEQMMQGTVILIDPECWYDQVLSKFPPRFPLPSIYCRARRKDGPCRSSNPLVDSPPVRSGRALSFLSLGPGAARRTAAATC